MIKIYAITEENNKYYWTEIHHKRPRAYMTGYTFEQLMKYVKEELYWQDINEEEVLGFEITDKHCWTESIMRNKGE